MLFLGRSSFSSVFSLFIVFVMTFSIMSWSMCLESKAASQTYYELTSKFDEPMTSDNCGYLNLAIEGYWSALDLCTIAWEIVPLLENEALDGNYMHIDVYESSIKMKARIPNSTFLVNIWELQPSGYASLLYSGEVSDSYERTTSWNGGTIVGATAVGNVGTFSYYGGSYVPSISTVWNNQGLQISKYNDILNALELLNSSLGGKLDDLISEVQDIFLQVDKAEDALSRIRDLIIEYFPKFEGKLNDIFVQIDSAEDLLTRIRELMLLYYPQYVDKLDDIIDLLGSKLDIGNQLQQESNNLQKEENETSRGILSKVTDFFGSFFDNLVNSVIGVFVPSTADLSALFDRLNQFFSDTFGFLYYPFDFIIQAFNVFLSSDSSTGLTFPGFSIMGYEVWGDLTYDLGADEVAGSIFSYVRIGTGAILSMFFVGYLRAFFEKRFGGGGS